MKVGFIKTIPNAVIPKRANADDAGFDLVAISKVVGRDYIEYDTGIAVEIPFGYMGLLFPRSSISKYDLVLCNSVGVIDSGYRDSIKARFRSTSVNGSLNDGRSYKIGDKIAQLIVVALPIIAFEEVDKLTSSERGLGGFGSSGV